LKIDSFTMSTKIKATLDDLYKTSGKAELVNGEIVQMSLTGGLPNYAALEITFSLRQYARRTGTGHAVSDNAAFVVNLPHRRSFSPDAAYYRGDVTMKFFAGAPVFAVEVRSESDYGPDAERELAAKRSDYFAAGTHVVWDVDLLSADVIKVYRASAPDKPVPYRRGQLAEAEPAVPEWTMAVDDLFPTR
jgi:Uma2 family endonuclease